MLSLQEPVDITEVVEVKIGGVTLIIEIDLATAENMIKHHIQSAAVPVGIVVDGVVKYPRIKWKVEQPPSK